MFVRYNDAGAFVKKQASAIQGLATGDLDGNGKDEVIADFGIDRPSGLLQQCRRLG